VAGIWKGRRRESRCKTTPFVLLSRLKSPFPFPFKCLPRRLGNVEWQQRLKRLVYIQLREICFFLSFLLHKAWCSNQNEWCIIVLVGDDLWCKYNNILTIFVNPEIKTAKSQFWVHAKLNTLLLILLTQIVLLCQLQGSLGVMYNMNQRKLRLFVTNLNAPKW